MSKFWKDMFVKTSCNNKLENNNNFIISEKEPINRDLSKKVDIIRGIEDDDGTEVYRFIKNQNIMQSGNITLLPFNELKKYLSFDGHPLLMRGGSKKSLVGFVISIPFKVRCLYNDDEKIITHGCTSFLNVHKSLRGHGMCMTLIRELIKWGYEKKIYCGYHTTENKIGSNGVKINSWYRPLHLDKSIKLGFLYPDYDDIRSKRKTRLKYDTKIPSSCEISRVLESNHIESLEVYKKLVESKKFSFYPELSFWKRWVQYFPTYIVKKDNQYVGLYTLTSLHCRIQSTQMDGNLATPLICVGEMPYTLSCLIHTAKERNYDVLYLYEIGDIDNEVLVNSKALKTNTVQWFNMYNNNISLNATDIYVPLL